MGNTLVSLDAKLHPDVAPNHKQPPTFDPQKGFPNGRKERVMIATQEEMDAANVPVDKRDYCAHKYIDWVKCLKEESPWFGYFTKCAHLKHDHHHCEYEDFVLRMKEYEREKRLLKREKRLREKQMKEKMAA